MHSVIVIILAVALAQANNDYSSKLTSGHATKQAVFSLGWKVDELSRLAELG